MSKPIAISGIQPSGRLHIGNYLGALQNFVKLQNSKEYECLFFIADLHSLTEDYIVSDKKEQIIDLMATYLAAGLDPKKSTMFIQSRIPAHTELSWVLNTLAPMGELNRMTQFKDKSETGNINLGLFSYPVLMAADVLLYDARVVPVGQDQLQHLELTRILARKFNGKYGETFVEPQPLLTTVPKLMNLLDPTKKMSKSSPSGCLFIDDSEEETKKKVMSAVTDSGNEIKFDIKEKPGISNLLQIANAISDKSVEDIEEELKDSTYSDLKEKVADMINQYFAPLRKKKGELLRNKSKVINVFEKGTQKAKKIADKRIVVVKEKIGLI